MVNYLDLIHVLELPRSMERTTWHLRWVSEYCSRAASKLLSRYGSSALELETSEDEIEGAQDS